MKCPYCLTNELTTGDINICRTCADKFKIQNNAYYSVDQIKNKFDTFIANQQSIPKEYVDIINKYFWELI